MGGETAGRRAIATQALRRTDIRTNNSRIGRAAVAAWLNHISEVIGAPFGLFVCGLQAQTGSRDSMKANRERLACRDERRSL